MFAPVLVVYASPCQQCAKKQLQIAIIAFVPWFAMVS